MTAALKLLDAGYKIIIIEKENHMGGNSAKASSGMNSIFGSNDENAFEIFKQDSVKSRGG
jgi:FAD-dependent fumarate reductase